jgi:DNA-binding NarL/FixJ family response regulator
MSTTTIKLAIVDDHTLFRNGLAALLNEFPALEVIFQANNGAHLQELIKTYALPDVILMDINMTVMNGHQSTAWLKANYPTVKVIALSMLNDEKEVITMLRNGACGYMVKESDPKELLEGIKAVHQNGIFLNELVSGKLLHAVIHQKRDDEFNLRELDFLKLCCSELTYKEMASEMCVSVRTIDNYRDSLFNKLNLRSRTGLVLYAIKHHLVNLPSG